MSRRKSIRWECAEEQAEAARAEFNRMWVDQWRVVLIRDFKMTNPVHLAGAETIAWRAFMHLKCKPR